MTLTAHNDGEGRGCSVNHNGVVNDVGGDQFNIRNIYHINTGA